MSGAVLPPVVAALVKALGEAGIVHAVRWGQVPASRARIKIYQVSGCRHVNRLTVHAAHQGSDWMWGEQFEHTASPNITGPELVARILETNPEVKP